MEKASVVGQRTQGMHVAGSDRSQGQVSGEGHRTELGLYCKAFSQNTSPGRCGSAPRAKSSLAS